MCLAIPGKIESISGDDPLSRMGKINFGGILKEACLAYVPEAKVGDYVIVHVGFALSRVDEDEAHKVFEYLKEMEELGELEEVAGDLPADAQRQAARHRNMKYLDEYRDGERAQQFAREIHRVTTRPWNIMEVCGGQTHAIVKFGIDELLPKTITLIHGPGCPVCVTPLEMIDKALEIAARPGHHFRLVRRHAARARQHDGFAFGQGQGRRRAHRLFAARCRETRGTKSGEGSCFLRRRF